MSEDAVEVVMDRLSKQGEAVGLYEGRSVFVGGALPGERVRVLLLPDGKQLRGVLLEVLSKSPARRDPRALCPLSDRCGGCDFLYLTEEAQRAAKQEILLSALEHLGGLSRGAFEVRPMIASAHSLGYRRRATLHLARGQLAYFSRHSHDKVPVERCPALAEPLEALLGPLSQALAPLSKDVDEVQLLTEGGRTSVAVRLTGPLKQKHRDVAQYVVGLAGLSGLVLLPKEGAAQLWEEPVLRTPAPLAPHVFLHARPDAFAQANAAANTALVESSMKLLAPLPADRALELYCGNGNLTFALAARVAQTVAVESARVSLELARRSAREAKVANLRFIEGDTQKVVQGLLAERQRFDVLLVDPPRAGAKGVGAWARGLGVRQVAYVSCDPASLARDARELVASGFTPGTLQGVDMFPQTRHVEAVMSFHRRDAA